MSELANTLEYFFTSWPFPTALLLLIIGLGIFWFTKIKPERDAKEQEREENRAKAERERGEQFVKVMTHCEETSKNTIVMYEKALDNSTKAIENNTAALKMMTFNLENLINTSKAHDEGLEKIEKQTQENIKTLVKIATLLESKD